MSNKNGVISYVLGGSTAAFTIPPTAADGQPGITYSGENVRVTLSGDFLPTALRVTVQENMGLGGWVDHIDDNQADAVFSAVGGAVFQLPAGNQIRLSITGADSTTSSGTSALYYRITDMA